MLSKNDILNADDRQKQTVLVPEWGGDVMVSSMTGADRDKFEQSMMDDDNLENIRARLVGLTLIDAEGKRLFSDAEITQLGTKSARALDRIFKVAQALNGIGAEETEAIVKN